MGLQAYICAHASSPTYMRSFVCARKNTRTSLLCTFLNFYKMDYFPRLRLAQRLVPSPISHLSLISLGMNVCVTVCIFFACVCESECVHVCLPCYRCLCSLMGDRNKNKSISLLNHTLSSTTWQLTTAASVSARVRERVRGYTCVCV